MAQHRRMILLTTLLMAVSLCLPSLAAGIEKPHDYLDIPYDTATPEIITTILAEKKNAAFQLHPDGVLSGKAEGVNEFGYEFTFTHDFNEHFLGTYRISLTSAQPSSFSQEEYAARIPADLAQYVDMETQLTDLYGEPDRRYFITSLMNGKKYIRFMFPDGRWSPETMQAVCDAHQLLKAYTIWDNVVLEIKMDLTQPYTEGIFYSYITLYYYPSVDDLSFVEKYDIQQYEGND